MTDKEWKHLPESLRLDVDFAQRSADFAFKTAQGWGLILGIGIALLMGAAVGGWVAGRQIEKRLQVVEQHCLCGGQVPSLTR